MKLCYASARRIAAEKATAVNAEAEDAVEKEIVTWTAEEVFEVKTVEVGESWCFCANCCVRYIYI